MTDEAPTVREPAGTAEPAGAFPERYQAGGELGRGGMGRVVEARDRLLGRTVALKEALATDEDALRRFARETQITARLEHPSIVPIYDAGVSSDGSPFYVMRKLTGRPLDALVAAAPALADRLALLPHVLAACQAVAHAHERGVIHRDLKPANILAGARGETTVIDWGLAKATGEADGEPRAAAPAPGDSLHTRAGTVFGTPGFMSPEQQRSTDVDERADVYALGATLYHVLARRPPPADATAPSIAEVAPGVPRELAAIVDKALAHDLAVRYRDAGALAEDLARFTTGQLVAAHAYSTRERFARFVRRHRALVVTVAAALAVFAAGAWIAVGRVLAARDEAVAQARAAEAARERESERASDLVVSQARVLLATNPAGAIAMVRPLAATHRWREVRAIAAGARAAGVPWRLPGPAQVGCGDLSPGGTRALVCGSDGTIHLYELSSRTHEVIARLQGRVRAAFAGEDRVLAWVGATLSRIDLPAKTIATFERPAPIRRLSAQHGVAYYVDDRARAWRFDVATGTATEIPVPGGVTQVAIAPDGKHVAFAGEHLWMIEPRHPELVEQVHAEPMFDLAWAPAGDRLAAIGQRQIFDITIHPEVEVTTYELTNQGVALARGLLYTTGPSGLTVGAEVIDAADMTAAMAGLAVTRGEHVVAGGRTSLIVFDGKHSTSIPLPATPLNMLLASPRAPYVVAVCANTVLLWNIEEVVPRRVAVPAYAQIVPVGPDRVWTISFSERSLAVDVTTGALHELPHLPPLRHSAVGSGAWLVARPMSATVPWIIHADGTIDEVAIEATFAVVLDGGHVALATATNELVIYDVERRTPRIVATLPGPVDRLRAREGDGRWLVAALVDGTLSRHDLATGRTDHTRGTPRTDAFSPGLACTPPTRTGDVFFASGTRLRRWRPDGGVADHVMLPHPIHAAHLLDDERILVLDTERTAYLVDTDRGELVRLPALGMNYAWGSRAPTLIVTDDRTGGVTVVDVVANMAWKIARATPAGATPDITSDGSVVVMRDAMLDTSAIALWDLGLPATREATAAWVEGLTNATFDPRTGMLGWLP